MKLSKFKLTGRTGKSCLNYEYKAEVDVTTGVLLWKKTETKKLMREYAGNWYFVESGEWTPGSIVETMERAWIAQADQHLHEL